jgi:hypothetical protein
METTTDYSTQAVVSSNEQNLDIWNTVAGSYDARDGTVQYINGIVSSTTISLRQHATYGDVVMGTRYHHSLPSNRDARAFEGKMSCMRLWSEVKDRGTMFLHAPLCYNTSSCSDKSSLSAGLSGSDVRARLSE